MPITLKKSANPEEHYKHLIQQRRIIREAKGVLQNPDLSTDDRYRNQDVRSGAMTAVSVLSEEWDKVPDEKKEEAILRDGFKKNPRPKTSPSPTPPFPFPQMREPSRTRPEPASQDSKEKKPYQPFPSPRPTTNIRKQTETPEDSWTDITPVQAPKIPGGVPRVRLYAWENNLGICLYTNWPDYGSGDTLNILENAEQVLDKKIEAAQKDLPEVKQKDTTSQESSLHLEEGPSHLEAMRVLKPPTRQDEDK